MQLTQKEVIEYYKYIYLKMNIKPIKQLVLNKIDSDFITKIFTDINFFNNPCFENFDLLKLYTNLRFILMMYEKPELKLNR